MSKHIQKKEVGLTYAQARARLKKYGYNTISEKEESSLERLFKKFLGPIPWLIEIAAVLSAIAHRWADFIIILILLLVNVLVSYLQESEALNTLKVLKKSLAKNALVIRNGEFKTIDASLLVPGDVIKLKLGDIVPADVELISGDYLEIDQSSITGESLPVNKKIGEEVYSGSIVRMGVMLAKVTKTGTNTFFGKSASLVKKAEQVKKSHFQKAVIQIGDFLIILTAIFSLLILVISLFRHDNFLEMLRFLLVLVVASIPVALPAVLSVTMAVGALSIARKKAILTDLSSIEELAGVDVLCSDKTGTLTQNKMTIAKPTIYSHFTLKDLFLYALLASQEENKDPIEQPLFEYVDDKLPKLRSTLKKYTLKHFIPFDPIRKCSEATYTLGKKKIVVVKGAPQVVARLCSQTPITKKMLSDVSFFAQKGYRTLAVAVKTKNTFKCTGLIPLFDPPRKDSRIVIEELQEKGLDIKMLTGDNHKIALQIAELLKIGTNILDSSDLSEDSSQYFSILSKVIAEGMYKSLKGKVVKKNIDHFTQKISEDVKKELQNVNLNQKYIKKHESHIIELIEKANGFSQVLPQDKYMIVDELQKKGHIVAMTGDGVNDAPALKKADMGIAVSGATDAARSAADLVLLSSGLSVIDHAITLARRTFERMKSYAIFRIAETIRIILFMTLSIIIFNFYPVTALMIVVLALLNDIPIMMIAYDNVQHNKKPVRWNMKEVLTISSVLGLAGVASSFLLFYWLQTNNYPLLLIQTLLFIKLDVAGHSTIYLTRTGRHHFWHKPFPSLKFFLPAFGSRIIGTLIAVYGIFMQPIGWKYAAIMWTYAGVWWIFNDFVKVLAYKFLDKHKLLREKKRISR